MSIKFYYPELEYFFYDYWKNFGESTIYNIKIPDVITNIEAISDSSFLELLFSSAYSNPDYLFTFEQKNANYCSCNIRGRLYNSSSMCKVYFISGLLAGETDLLDIFGIAGETETLLNLLLSYRLTGYCDLSTINYDDLTKCMSKLIYQYLDLMLNGNYDRIYTSVVQADDKDILCGLYELYLVNEAYRFIRDTDITILNRDTILRPGRTREWVDEDILSNSRLIEYETPYNSDNFWFFVNGTLIPRTKYDVILDDTSFTVDWNGSDLEVELDDILITDFYIEVQNVT